MIKKMAISASERLLDGVNLVLLAGTVLIVLGVVGLLVHDLLVFYRTRFTSGVGTLLGTLLVLWVLAEFLRSQIEHLKGGRLDVRVFVMVAIVAFIRKLMVASLTPENLEVAYYPVIVIMVLAVVYWMVKERSRE